MAAPISIVAPRLKRASFRARRSYKMLILLPHPLEFPEEDSSESDAESMLDSSYNESVLSFMSDSSCGHSVLHSPYCTSPSRASVTPAVVVALWATADLTKAQPHSKSLLLQRLSEQIRSEGKADNRRREAKSWRTLLASFINYAFPFSPRSTDDTVPAAEWPEEAPVLDQELVTFSAELPEAEAVAVTPSRIRNRDYRINCTFLQRYALDYAARSSCSLPSSHTPEELKRLLRKPLLRRFDSEYGLHRVSTMSKDKLWDAVILPPRKDPSPANVVDYASYTHVGQGARSPSLTTKTGNFIPWAVHQSSLKPAGMMKTSRPLANEASPTASSTIPQYTIKGWVNERWVPIEA